MAPADILRPRLIRAGAGEKARVITDLVTTKASAEDTGGAYSLFEVVTPPTGGCPPHAHRHEEKTFYVLDGRYVFFSGEEPVEMGPGDCTFVPRGTVHAFTNPGPKPAQMLVLVTPGGIHDRFYEEIGDCADRPALEPDMARVLAVAPKFGIEFLPPDAVPEAWQRGQQDSELLTASTDLDDSQSTTETRPVQIRPE